MGSMGLSIGLRALLTSQSALETIGHNVANANTPGYSRQQLDVSATPGLKRGNLLLGSGVQGDVVRRTVDELLDRRMLQHIASLGRLSSRSANLGEIESALGAGTPHGVSELLQGFFSSLAELSTAPDDAILGASFVQAGLQLTDQLNAVATTLEEQKQGLAAALEAEVAEINTLAGRVETLNDAIVAQEPGGQPANDLRDQRDEALRALAGLIDIRVTPAGAGAVRVHAANGLLVHPGGRNQVELAEDAAGRLGLRLGDSPNVQGEVGGRLGAELAHVNETLPALQAELDAFAANLIFEANRRHASGVPASGPMRALTASNRLADLDGDGLVSDELLAQDGLPSAVVDGVLSVNVTNLATGAVEQHQVAISASHTTAGDLLGELNAIPNLTASLDSQGRIQLLAANGFGFDFSRKLDPNPDPIGSFGGGAASLASAANAPFALAGGETLQVQGPLGTANVTFQAGDFALPGAATAAEVAAAINADPSTAPAGLVAHAVGGKLVLQSASAGSAQSLTLGPGSALAALGWSAGTTAAGHDQAVGVAVEGTYTGAANDVYTFEALGDGTIGTTPGLQIAVRNQAGQLVKLLDVGAGYTPGQPLEVASGVRASFGFGELSASDHDAFELPVIADSDSAQVLTALGLNALFTGSGAADIGVSAAIAADPSRLASSASGAPGDAGALLELLALEHAELQSLAGGSLSEGLAGLVTGVASSVASSAAAEQSEAFLLDGLQSRRDELSGVNVDEELVRLIEYEQAFSAAGTFIRVMSEVSDELLNLI